MKTMFPGKKKKKKVFKMKNTLDGINDRHRLKEKKNQ